MTQRCGCGMEGPVFILPLEGHSGSVLSATFSPDGSSLASASIDGTVRLWNSETDGLVAAWNSISGPANSLTFSPDKAAEVRSTAAGISFVRRAIATPYHLALRYHGTKVSRDLPRLNLYRPILMCDLEPDADHNEHDRKSSDADSESRPNRLKSVSAEYRRMLEGYLWFCAICVATVCRLGQ
jgi:WD40 repeat protein